ncbi:hypothetical protein CSOJ01_09183 [Colletotrichum sojae]|uniref:Ubiquitin-like protease family profile domain-containing protein n=1 Tax=Colletotrichum sojae TaxID=2175907 RepID=A0A8H6J3R5_9PEZI|nr:hypothetical protein CSOJ01_09183 [Colletotrichum sojae]
MPTLGNYDAFCIYGLPVEAAGRPRPASPYRHSVPTIEATGPDGAASAAGIPRFYPYLSKVVVVEPPPQTNVVLPYERALVYTLPTMTLSTQRHVLFRHVRLALDDLLEAIEAGDGDMRTEVQRQKIIVLWENVYSSYYRAIAENEAEEKPLPLWLLSQASTVQLERILRCVYYKHDVNNGEWRFEIDNIPTTRGLDSKWNLYLFFGKQVMASRKALRHLQDAAKDNPGLKFIDIFNQIEFCRLQRLRGPAKSHEPLYTQADIQRGAKLASNLPLSRARSTPPMYGAPYDGGESDDPDEPDESDASDESDRSDGSYGSDGSVQPGPAHISDTPTHKTSSRKRPDAREPPSPTVPPVQSTKASLRTRLSLSSTRQSSAGTGTRFQHPQTSPIPATPVNPVNLKRIASVSLNQRWPTGLQNSANVRGSVTRSRAKSAALEAESSRRFVTPDQTPTLKRSAHGPIGTSKRQKTFTGSVPDEPRLTAIASNETVVRERTSADCSQVNSEESQETELGLTTSALVSEALIDSRLPRDYRNDPVSTPTVGTSPNKRNVQNDSQPTPPNEQSTGVASPAASATQMAPRNEEHTLTSVTHPPEINDLGGPSRDRAQSGEGNHLPYLMWGLAGASQRISEHQQLNDAAVNALVAMACRESSRNLGCVESHSLATFDVQAKRVRPYHRDLCSKDALLLVIHHEDHWALVHWDPRAHVADYYDPLSSPTTAVERRAKHFVESLSKWFTSVNLLPAPRSELVFNKRVLLLKEKRLELEVESLCTKLEAYFHIYRTILTAENTIQWQKQFYRGLESFQKVAPLIKLEAQWRQTESSPPIRDAGRVWLPDQVWDRQVDTAIQKIRELQQDLLPRTVWNSFVNEETGETPFYMGGVSIVVIHVTAQTIRKKMEDMTGVAGLMRTFQEGVEKLGLGSGSM